MMQKRALWVLALVFLGCVLGLSCGTKHSTVFGSGGSTASMGSAVGGAGATASTESGFGFDAGMQECSTDADCNGGVCVNGICCDSAAQACGDICCGSTEVCLFDACLVPGDDCYTEADCPPDHYCEPALGTAGTGGAGTGGNCTQPLPPAGKCVPNPKICGEGGAGGGDCIEQCEYQPPVGGLLGAVVKWQWGYAPPPTEFPDKADVWSTPVVARVFDANCDGKIDQADPPNIIVVSGDANDTWCGAANVCDKGVLRVLDGKSGEEIWTLEKPEASSTGFAGLSVAVGNVDTDPEVEIVALSGEGKVVIVSNTGVVEHISTTLVNGATASSFGWGGGVALGDMNNDGWVEIAYANSVFTMAGGTLAHLFTGSGGVGASAGNLNRPLSHFVDLDGDNDLELLGGKTAYHHDGSVLWTSSAPDGFTATGDFDGDGLPEIVIVNGGSLYILEGLTGAVEISAHNIPGTGSGGPPTVADFDGDGKPEIGVAMATYYTMMKPNCPPVVAAGDLGCADAVSDITDVWSKVNHDNSSSVTGSSVFDFEGDGKAEVLYMDECFLWVYDGATGTPRFTVNSQSFTATEAAVVADVDGDGHAEIVVVHNAANPNGGWHCAHHTTGTDNYPVWSAPAAGGYRGVTVYGDSANSWVGTRKLWNQHAYSVTNVCDPRDSACTAGSTYGQIPQYQKKNWQEPWLNSFRQNVQDEGLFNAPDGVLLLDVPCVSPVPMQVKLRNIGLAGLPAGVEVELYRTKPSELLLGSVMTNYPLAAGQTALLEFTASVDDASVSNTFQARIKIDPNNPTFHECREDNNESAEVTPNCVQ